MEVAGAVLQQVLTEMERMEEMEMAIKVAQVV